MLIGPINLPVGRLFVGEVITECRKRGASRVDVLAFEFEMGLFPAVLEEARGKGIDLAPKYIPAEVFDKRAVDNRDAAKRGGAVAGNARKELEAKSGKPVVSRANHLGLKGAENDQVAEAAPPARAIKPPAKGKKK